MRVILATVLILASTASWAQSINGNVRSTPDRSGLGQFSAQAPVRCAQGQVYNPNSRECVVPSANQDLSGYYIGGALILSGVIGAIVLANDGNKTTSP
jgi:hypothetical protein